MLGLSGDVTGLRGDVTGLSGDVTGIYGILLGLYGKVTGLGGDVTGIYGDVTGIYGKVTGLSGRVTGLDGDVTGLDGDVTGLKGDVTGIYGKAPGLGGNIDDCEITEEERRKGINIEDLINCDGETKMKTEINGPVTLKDGHSEKDIKILLSGKMFRHSSISYVAFRNKKDALAYKRRMSPLTRGHTLFKL